MEPPQGWTKLRRQSTDLVSQMQQKLPSMPQLRRRSRSLWASQQPHEPTGSWQGIDLAPLARSSHSLNVVAGAAYLFGGEVHPGQLADNHVHVLRLPYSGAGADYFCAPAVAAAAQEEEEQEEEEEDNDKDAEADAEADEHGKQHDDDDVYATPDEKTDSSMPADEQLTPPSSAASKGKQRAVADQPLGHSVPSPRLGHATAVIGARILLFGGTASDTGLPLDEAGRVWVFDTRSRRWSHLDPVDPEAAVPGSPVARHPLPRSHHCAAATDHPRASSSSADRRRSSRTWREWALGSESASRTGIPQNPIVGVIAEDAVDEETRGYGTLFIHAGCLADGSRASDIWAFDVRSRTWTQLPAAPGPGRANTAICLSKSRLFRFGGSDGERCLGQEIDVLPLELDTFGDSSSLAQVFVSAHGGGWQTLAAPPSSPSTSYPASPTAPALVSSPSASEAPWPSPRTAPALHALTLGGGRQVLVLTMGMTTASPLADVWTFQVPPLAMSAASLGDAFRQAVGRRTGDGCWTCVQMKPLDADQWQMAAAPDACMPRPRSHIASAPMTDVEDNAIVLWGGIGEEGACLGDGWILRLNG
ncbi:hypothetical protein CDD82_1752 [Ophiocordyceps australis]|uniref:Uncharacterized protein n=1 Tax=Ophiocordyceps australis TaxID=1399860 RepID=A0A2C5YC87_9HYPO|nr:hypothetical protein CDD82_1752 [Ophiocordyceps australis]